MKGMLADDNHFRRQGAIPSKGACRSRVVMAAERT